MDVVRQLREEHEHDHDSSTTADQAAEATS
jgi:hypothetical protein